MIAKTTLLIMALMTTVVSISAEGLERRMMKCIWVSVSSRHNAKEQDIVSRANQYLGRSVYVEIDSIKNIHNTHYIIGHDIKWKKIDSKTFVYHNEIENFKFIFYAKYSDDFSCLSLKKIVWEGEPDWGMAMRNEFFITEYYVDVAQKVEPCKSQDEFESNYSAPHGMSSYPTVAQQQV